VTEKAYKRKPLRLLFVDILILKQAKARVREAAIAARTITW
jgi:hypothetical protein